MNKKVIITILAAIGIVALVSAPVSAVTCVPRPEPQCSSILPESWCKENGVWEILNLVLSISTAGIGVLATIGIIISGIQWLTARDKEDQVVKAKSRLFNIVIGLLTFGIMWLFLQWLLPGGLLSNNPVDIKEIPVGTGGCPPGQMPDQTQPPETQNPSNPDPTAGRPGTGQQTTAVIGDSEADSTSVPCDPRTINLGIHEGWNAGRRVNFNLCSVSNLTSTTTDGYTDILQKAGQTGLSGKAVLNSRVAGAVYSMVEAAKADGITLSAGSTFRSFEWSAAKCGSTPNTMDRSRPDIIQKAYDERDSGKPVIDRVTCTQSSSMLAPPGFSNHQSGTAIDFKKCSRGVANAGPCPDAMYVWLRANAGRFGFSQYSREYWHYDTR